MPKVDIKSALIGAAIFWATLKFLAPKVPALNALRP